MLLNNKIQLNYWVNTPNFGDLLSPYLMQKLTGLEVEFNDGKDPQRPPPLLAIGSIAKRATEGATVWGSGFFGDETASKVCSTAHYAAVRGPLTRNILRMNKIACPEIYGDPALLLPMVYNPTNINKKYKLGVVLRWSEKKWNEIQFGSGIKKIYLGTSEIESTIDNFLECDYIVSSSLHGVIIADTYGIPSAWIDSRSPRGLNFKFYDYFLSVDKVQKPQKFMPTKQLLNLVDIFNEFKFDDRNISINFKKLINSFPLKEFL